MTVAGIVMNQVTDPGSDESIETNSEEIEARSGATVFGTIPHGSDTELHRQGKPVTINWKQLNRS